MHIQLLKPHIHAGRQRAVGERIQLDEDLAQWLIRCRVARPIAFRPKQRQQSAPKEPEQATVGEAIGL